MGRRPEFCAGYYYHFYNRGAHRLSLFREAENYSFVLRRIKKYISQFSLSVVAYCLLPNHYHLLVRQDGQQPARLLPQRVFNSYSKAYNKRYDHTGTLFEGPSKVKAVKDESHLLHLCRCIHSNPVTHGLVTDVTAWPYSNYLEWIAERSGTLVDRELVSAHFQTRESYERFVQSYIQERQLPPALDRYLGRWSG